MVCLRAECIYFKLWNDMLHLLLAETRFRLLCTLVKSTGLLYIYDLNDLAFYCIYF